MGLLAELCFISEQGGLAHSLQVSNKGVTDTAVGLAAVVRTHHLMGVASVEGVIFWYKVGVRNL